MRCRRYDSARLCRLTGCAFRVFSYQVVNISATLQYGAAHWQIHASAAKSAIDSMTRSWALEWGNRPYQIRVNGIAPGPIADTPGTTKLAPTSSSAGGAETERATNGKSQVDDWVTTRIPLQRMGRAEEIGHAVLYLCTAQYVTGATLVVDGGEWLYKPPLISRQQVAILSRHVEAASRAQRPTRRTDNSNKGDLRAPPPPSLQSML
jgi:2,4-dienoyl-CoA reductase [(3E)-enoyl-CoA-producing], peroxisomal